MVRHLIVVVIGICSEPRSSLSVHLVPIDVVCAEAAGPPVWEKPVFYQFGVLV